ncbi:MAG: hypothetical protein WCK90_01480 [archaeon]
MRLKNILLAAGMAGMIYLTPGSVRAQDFDENVPRELIVSPEVGNVGIYDLNLKINMTIGAEGKKASSSMRAAVVLEARVDEKDGDDIIFGFDYIRCRASVRANVDGESADREIDYDRNDKKSADREDYQQFIGHKTFSLTKGEYMTKKIGNLWPTKAIRKGDSWKSEIPIEMDVPSEYEDNYDLPIVLRHEGKDSYDGKNVIRVSIKPGEVDRERRERQNLDFSVSGKFFYDPNTRMIEFLDMGYETSMVFSARREIPKIKFNADAHIEFKRH